VCPTAKVFPAWHGCSMRCVNRHFTTSMDASMRS
jgi:hypothetical protein